MQFHAHTVCTQFNSPLGRVIASASPLGLSGLWFHDQKHLPNWQQWPALATHPQLKLAEHWLLAHLAGSQPVWQGQLDLSSGTGFQQSVWQQLLGIGCGHTRSYGELAQAVGKPLAARAVGAAVGKNPISVIVPCHRVVGAQGALTGYAGGLVRKTELLRVEGVLA